MAEKLGTIVAVPMATKTVHIKYKAIQGSEHIYIILSAIYRALHLDVQLLFSNLFPRTFPKGWLLTTARKRMKALKRVINQLRVIICLSPQVDFEHQALEFGIFPLNLTLLQTTRLWNPDNLIWRAMTNCNFYKRSFFENKNINKDNSVHLPNLTVWNIFAEIYLIKWNLFPLFFSLFEKP